MVPLLAEFYSRRILPEALVNAEAGSTRQCKGCVYDRPGAL